MRNFTRKTVSLMLIFALIFCTALPGAGAEEASAPEREIDYGFIQVQTQNAQKPRAFRAAAGEDGLVYIRAEDFAEILDAEIRTDVFPVDYRFVFGLWNIDVYLDDKTAEVYFNPNQKTFGYELYGEFPLTDCLYNESDGSWYLPLEEMLYMAHTQWACTNQIIYTYTPETLFDILIDAKFTVVHNPTIVDILGEDEWDQVGNSFKFGFLAAIDELDMSFLWDTMWAVGSSGTTGYEDDALKTALLMLSSDASERNKDAEITDGYDTAADFLTNISNGLDVASDEDLYISLRNMLGLTMTQTQMNEISLKAGVGTILVNYAIGVGQALWIRDYMPESFGQRIQAIQEYCAGAENGTFMAQLEKVSEDTYDLYYGDVTEAYTQYIKLDDIFSMVDGVALLGGVDLGKNDIIVTPLRWAKLGLAVFDTGIELMKAGDPTIAELLNNAEDIFLCKNLVSLSWTMYNAYGDSLDIFSRHYETLDQDELDAIRASLQVYQCAALHARDKLIDLEMLTDDGWIGGQQFLQRLEQSAKYDKLLMLDTDYTDINCEDPGCVRMRIPASYVFRLPLLRMWFQDSVTEAEIAPELEGYELPAGQKAYLTIEKDRWNMFTRITIRHETYGEVSFEPTLAPMGAFFYGVDMGDGQYTYVLEAMASGSIGGADILILRPVDGKLQIVKQFGLYEDSDEIYVTGSFLDSGTVSLVIYPTGTAFEGEVAYPMEERTGTEIWGTGTGYIDYELCEDGCYDLIYCTKERNLYNLDMIGGSQTRYTLIDGELTLTEQWYELSK